MSVNSKRRRKSIVQDVERRAWYAFSSGNRENPYPPEDPRHPLFSRRLTCIDFLDSESEDLHKTNGCDTGTWKRRVHPNPGPVRPIEQLTL